jgi:hypothetical protein
MRTDAHYDGGTYGAPWGVGSKYNKILRNWPTSWGTVQRIDSGAAERRLVTVAAPNPAMSSTSTSCRAQPPVSKEYRYRYSVALRRHGYTRHKFPPSRHRAVVGRPISCCLQTRSPRISLWLSMYEHGDRTIHRSPRTVSPLSAHGCHQGDSPVSHLTSPVAGCLPCRDSHQSILSSTLLG